MTTHIGKTNSNQNLPFIQWLSELPNLLVRVDRSRRILFLAACGERQFGNYARFHTETNWGNPLALCEGLRVLWNYAGPTDNGEIRRLRKIIEEATPNTEDFKSVYTSGALDAATVVLESFDYCLDDDINHCVEVACTCRDSVYMFVQLQRGYDYSDADEVKIYSDPVVMKELLAQQSDLAMVTSLADGANPSIIAEKHRCDADGGSLSK